MLQIIRAILKNPSDSTNMWLIFANQVNNIYVFSYNMPVSKQTVFH